MTQFLAALVAVLMVASPLAADPARDQRVALIQQTVATLCGLPDLWGLDAQAAVPGSWLLEERRLPEQAAPQLIEVRLLLGGADEVVIERRQTAGQMRQFRVTYLLGGEASLLAIADGGCTLQAGREIRRVGPAWRFLDQLGGDLKTLRWTETLQAPWPEGEIRSGIRVGLIDSGLAYDLPLFRHRLARDADGQPLGYDFWDLDPWPYDGDVSRGPFLPIRHGTAVASVLAREAPDADLVPFRYPRPDMSRMGEAVARAAEAGVRVLAMPLGSRSKDDWTTFEAALAAHDILAIVSAGNDGRDIDAEPVYPAALPSERILTVTSADDFGRLAPGANWGGTSVDIMLPAENLAVVDFRGAAGVASGSSFAVPRLAAMAARILAQSPDLSAAELRARILARATTSPFEREGVVAAGWIANPLEE